jgi:hypothetical protein
MKPLLRLFHYCSFLFFSRATLTLLAKKKAKFVLDRDLINLRRAMNLVSTKGKKAISSRGPHEDKGSYMLPVELVPFSSHFIISYNKNKKEFGGDRTTAKSHCSRPPQRIVLSLTWPRQFTAKLSCVQTIFDTFPGKDLEKYVRPRRSGMPLSMQISVRVTVDRKPSFHSTVGWIGRHWTIQRYLR